MYLHLTSDSFKNLFVIFLYIVQFKIYQNVLILIKPEINMNLNTQ